MAVICKEFYAWVNLMPPQPDDFHVIGGVQVGNPGVVAALTKRHPQGFNPQILILDLSLIQQPGLWPQIVTCAQARYDEIVKWDDTYSSVEVYSDGLLLATIDHVDVVR